MTHKGFAVIELIAIITVFAMMTYALFATEPGLPNPATVPTVSAESATPTVAMEEER